VENRQARPYNILLNERRKKKDEKKSLVLFSPQEEKKREGKESPSLYLLASSKEVK